MRPEHRERLLHDQVHPYAGFAREVASTEDWLVDRDGNTADALNQLTELGQLGEIILLAETVEYVESYHQLFEGRIPGPLAEPVRTAVNASRASFYTGELGRDSHTEIVVGVDLDRQVGHALNEP